MSCTGYEFALISICFFLIINDIVHIGCMKYEEKNPISGVHYATYIDCKLLDFT